MKISSVMKGLLLTSMVLLSCCGYTQNNHASWMLAYDYPGAFIENKGQFPVANHAIVNTSEVLYAMDYGPAMVYFTTTGVVFAFNYKIVHRTPDGFIKSIKEFFKKEKEEKEIEVRSEIVRYVWENAYPAEVIPENITAGYFNYGVRVGNTLKSINNARAFSKITYKNIYPGIDIEFTTHPKGGFKYSLILHPDADISVFKMKFFCSGKLSLKKNGNLCIYTEFGDIVDHSPVSYYKNDQSSLVPSSFVLDDNIVSVHLGEYDHSRMLIIDPWTVTPNIPASNRVWAVDKDDAGNAYIYGGDMPMTLRKYNAAGVPLWTYSSPWDSAGYWVGTMITDRAGNSYITSGSNGEISKINAAGSVVWYNNPNGILGPLFEYWDLGLNCDETQLIVGGMRGQSALNVSTYRGVMMNINMTDGAMANYVVVGHVAGMNIKEVRSMTSAPDRNFYYLTLDSIGCINPSLGIQWQNNSGYDFSYGNPEYQLNGNLGIRAIRANNNYLYTSSGNTLHKRNLSDGSIINSVSIPGGIYNPVPLLGHYTVGNSGLELDSCGNVYVGSGTGMYKFDANLNPAGSYQTPSAVYDVAVTRNGEVIACGNNYVVSVNMSACQPYRMRCCPQISINVSNIVDVDCSGQPGSFNASASGGTAPYDFVLLNSSGATVASYSDVYATQSFTGLAAGTYTLNVLDANACPGHTTVVISQPNNFTAELSVVDETCSNSCDGQIACSVSGGTQPYTFLWSNGRSTQTITGLCAGAYTVTVTDGSGCRQTQTANVSSGIVISLNLTPVNEGCSGQCNGQISSSVSGGTSPYVYLWSNGQTSSNLAGLCAGTYRLTVTDANSCRQTSQAEVYTRTVINAGFTASPMSGGVPLSVDFTFTGTGAATYLWNFGDGTTSSQQNPNHIFDSTGTYHVVLIVNSGSPDFCPDTADITIITQLPSYIHVPNAFSPNGDGYNDEFTVEYRGISTFKGEIFNRWGKRLFEWTDPSKGWNGKTWTGDAASGVYYYIITAKGDDGMNYNLSGSITLLR